MNKRSLLLVATIVLAACAKETTQTTATTDTSATVATTTTQAAAMAPNELKEGLQTPESVLYDAEQDVYFVSNINGAPTAVDNNGYISRLNPDTLQGELRFIEGGHAIDGKNAATLNAPKGLAVLGDTLYVADLTTVRRFDRKTGVPKGEVKIPGSTFLNDLATDGKVVYVSDSGLKAGAGGNFDPTGTDAIWEISGDKAKKIASGKDLNRPNGLSAGDGHLRAVSFGANELYEIENGKKTNVVKIPKGSLDGLVRLNDGTFLVTSWESNSVFRGTASGPFTEVIKGVTSPADIDYDSKRKRVLVPHFTESRITIHPLE